MNIFRTSLYARVTIMLGALLIAGTLTIGIAAWRYAIVAADEAYDRLLSGAAFQIAESIRIEDGNLIVDPPVSAFDTLGLSSGDRIFYKVTKADGTLLTGYEALKLPARVASPTADPVLGNAIFSQEPVRWVSLGRYISEPNLEGWASIVVAQTRHARDLLAFDLTLKAIIILAIMSLLALAMVMVTVRAALAPLHAIGEAINRRAYNDLTPLSLAVPREIAPLAAGLNHFMQRLSNRLTILKRFIADAAHQIRTPLAALSSQIDLLAHESDPERQKQSIRRLQDVADRLGRLVSQLLDHAMVIHRSEAVAGAPVDLATLTRHALRDAIPIAAANSDLDVMLELQQEHITIVGDAVSLREAIVNLINNAVTHGGGRMLLVRVLQDKDTTSVEVVDDGGGIPPEKRAQMLQPFQSGSLHQGTNRRGSGLGLAIVQDVARMHHGEIRFEQRTGIGFVVALVLPQPSSSDAGRPS
jgi:two-component system, OmpR family, sensor histidine kinase TctE